MDSAVCKCQDLNIITSVYMVSTDLFGKKHIEEQEKKAFEINALFQFWK